MRIKCLAFVDWERHLDGSNTSQPCHERTAAHHPLPSPLRPSFVEELQLPASPERPLITGVESSPSLVPPPDALLQRAEDRQRPLYPKTKQIHFSKHNRLKNIDFQYLQTSPLGKSFFIFMRSFCQRERPATAQNQGFRAYIKS